MRVVVAVEGHGQVNNLHLELTTHTIETHWQFTLFSKISKTSKFSPAIHKFKKLKFEKCKLNTQAGICNECINFVTLNLMYNNNISCFLFFHSSFLLLFRCV